MATDQSDRTVGSHRALWRAGSLTYSNAGLFRLFFWLLWGDFAYYLKDRSVTPTMQLLLHQRRASDVIVGILLISLPAAIGLMVMPVVAYRSDRHRGRLGRRIPFLVPTIPFTFVAMLGLVYSPAIGGEMQRLLGRLSPGENVCVILSLAASWTLFEVCASVSNSVFLSLIADVVPREAIGRFFAFFRMVSLAAGMIFLYCLFGRIEEHPVPIFLGIGAVYCVGFTGMCLKVREGDYPPPPPATPAAGSRRGPRFHIFRFLGGARGYCRDCFALPFYRWIFLSFALTYMAGSAFDSFYVIYAKSLHMSIAVLGKFGALQLLLSLVQAYPIGWLSDRFHPLRLTLVALALLATSTLAAFFLVHDSASFGISLVICGTLAGFWLTASSSLPAVLFPRPKFAVLDSARLTTILIGKFLGGTACGWMLDLLHRNYRYLYLWWCVFAVCALLSTVAVYREFIRRGGPAHYTTPE